MRGQVTALYTRTNQESAHPHNRIKMISSLSKIPSYPLVAISKVQRWRGKAQGTEPSMFRSNQIAHLPSYQWPMPLRMLSNHHVVPHPHVFLTANQYQPKSKNIANILRHAFRGRHRSRQPFGCVGSSFINRRRQRKRTGCFQFSQRLQTAAELLLAAQIMASKMVAKKTR